MFSGRIACPHPERIWLEQRGLQRALYWHIEARVVLDLQEFPISVTNQPKFYLLSLNRFCNSEREIESYFYIKMFQANHRELHFSMVDGDFKKFEGKWSLKSGTTRYNLFTLLESSLM